MKKFFTLTLALLASFSLWADATHTSPATVTYGGKTFIDAANTPGNAGTDNVYLNYGTQVVDAQKGNWAWFSYTGTWSKSNGQYSIPDGAVGFNASSGSGSDEFNGRLNFKKASSSGQLETVVIYVTGTEEIGFIWENNNTTNDRWLSFELAEIASDGSVSGTPVTTTGKSPIATGVQYDKFSSLSHTKYYRLTISTAGASTSKFWSITFKRYVAPSCAATIPGNISKGDLTDGAITLTAAGSAETGDTWYWQATADGTDKTGTSGTSKTVNAAGTYYVRSYNANADCWSAAKSIELTAEDFLATPEVTFNNGAYVVGATALDLSTLFTSQNTNEVTFALKVASEVASVTDGAFSATKAGSYVVTATQAASATYRAVEAEATIVVTYPATGAAVVSYNVAIGTSNTELATASKDVNSSSISNLSDFTAAGGLTVSELGAGKTDCSTKLQTLAEKDADKYIYVTFDVAEGYEFTISSVTTNVVAVATAKTVEVVLSDEESTTESSSYSQSKNNTPDEHVFNFAGKDYKGTVTLKIYAYGATDHYRLGQPLTIAGTVSASQYAVTLAQGSNATAGGTATIDFNASQLTITKATTGTGELQGYYLEGGTTKVAEANGNLVTGDVDGYVTGGKWSRTSGATLFAVYSGSGSAINNVESSAKAVKVLKNGMLLIEKNGKTYTITGQVVR